MVEVSVAKVPVVSTVEWAEGPSHRLDVPAWEVTKVVVEASVAKVPVVATVEWAGGPSHCLDVLTIGSNVEARWDISFVGSVGLVKVVAEAPKSGAHVEDDGLGLDASSFLQFESTMHLAPLGLGASSGYCSSAPRVGEILAVGRRPVERVPHAKGWKTCYCWGETFRRLPSCGDTAPMHPFACRQC